MAGAALSSVCVLDGSRFSLQRSAHMGVSENSVPLNPMVNDHYPY